MSSYVDSTVTIQTSTVAFLCSARKIALEQPVQEGFRELWIVVYLLVELEVTLDHILEQVIDYKVERKASILGWINAHACLEGRIARQPLFYFSYAELIIFCEVSAKMLVQRSNNLR